MKKIFLIAGFSCLCAAANAQVANEYNKFDVGFAYGIKKVLNTPGIDNSAKFVHANINYNFTPYVAAIGEYQTGSMGGVINNTSFTNKYDAVVFRGQVQGGSLFYDSESRVARAAKNAYVGLGVGSMVFKNNEPLEPNSPKKPRNSSWFVPARAGYEFKIFINNAPMIKIDAAYQYSFMFNSGWDGFRSGKYNDTGHQFILGAKFGFLKRAAFGRNIKQR